MFLSFYNDLFIFVLSHSLNSCSGESRLLIVLPVEGKMGKDFNSSLPDHVNGNINNDNYYYYDMHHS